MKTREWDKCKDKIACILNISFSQWAYSIKLISLTSWKIVSRLHNPAKTHKHDQLTVFILLGFIDGSVSVEIMLLAFLCMI